MRSRAGTQEQVVLDIEGMTCVSCVDRLERILSRQPSVAEARVSLATRTAAIRCDVDDPSPLIAAIEKAGYHATVRRQVPRVAEEIKQIRRRLVVSAFFSFDVLVFSLVTAPSSRASMLAAWLFATPVMFYGGWPFLRMAVLAARHGTHTMDTLVASGALAAYTYSAGAALGGGHHAYFDTAAMIITLILLGRFLEATARMRAGDASRGLLERQATGATILDGDQERRVSVEELSVGDRVVVLPGERVPADGTVREGRSSVDLSMLTGESMPVDVAPGHDVVGASINGPGRLVVELTHVGSETRLAQIVRLLELAQASKAPIQRLADRIAAVFVPRIVLLSLAVFFVRLFFDASGMGAALMHAAAVLLVACPCSLGLATPAAIMAGSGRAAELGILFKGGDVFEAARSIDTVLIDKTGTLTEGAMSLRVVEAIGVSEREVLGLAAAAERGSEHPLARCVLAAAQERGVVVAQADEHVAEPGAGISALVGGTWVRVGRPDGLPTELSTRADALAAAGLTVFTVWRGGEPLGLLGASDAVKEGAVDAVAALRRWGIDVVLVSGDRRATVEAAAREAGIARAIAEVYPEGKVEEVRRLQAAGRKVAFVGDGVNDAPAIAESDLGIALGTGTDVAMEAGRVLILGDDIRQVGVALEVARKTFWVIAQNLTWAFAYNTLMIPLAVMAKVSPLVAAAAMAGSSVTVVANALRLRRYGRGATRRTRPADAKDFAATRPADLAPEPAPPEPFTTHRPEPLVAPPVAEEQPADGLQPPDPIPIGVFAKQEVGRIGRALGKLMSNQWDY